MNAQPGTEIRLGLFGQSHTVAQVCERTYARHYSDLRREAFDNHGITEDAFLPLWAQIQAGWLREQLPEQEPAQSATVSTNFGDIIFMAANFAHYGTGDGGLRLVASSVHREYSNTFVHVNESICILDESQVYISDPECSYVPVFVGSYIQIQIEIFACIFSVIYTYITDIQPRYSTVYMSYDFVICI